MFFFFLISSSSLDIEFYVIGQNVMYLSIIATKIKIFINVIILNYVDVY